MTNGEPIPMIESAKPIPTSFQCAQNIVTNTAWKAKCWSDFSCTDINLPLYVGSGRNLIGPSKICGRQPLKILEGFDHKFVSATFLLVCFVCLKEGTCETRKYVFYFTSKALFVLQIIKFQIFRYSNVMAS